jgi:hypothetical protein
VADADLAQLLGYLMHELAEREYVLRELLPIDVNTPMKFEGE